MLSGKTARILTFTVLLTILHAGAHAQERIHFRNYTVTDGLKSNTIWAISQDEQGYMWFGTKDGLSRFDGYQFKSFKLDKKNSSSIGNNFIRKIFKYDARTYWIGTEEGVYVLNLEEESFHRLDTLGSHLVFDILRDSRGHLWIATGDSGLFAYDPASGALKTFVHRNDDSNSISVNLVRCLAEDDGGNIWAGTVRGLDVLDVATSTFRHYRRGPQAGSISHNNIISLHKDLSGNMWVGTLTGGLNLYHAGSDTFTRYLKSGKNSINDNIVRAIYQPRPGKLYIGTEKGLNILDIPTQTFRHFTNKNNDPRSISDDAVYSIFEDREGGIWLGTYFGGVNYFHGQDTNFELYYPTEEKNTLSGNAVSAFLEDGPGKVWVGTEDGGLNLFDVENKTFRHYPFNAGQEKLSYHNIHTLYKDSQGNIWIGTFAGGLNVLNPRTGKIKKYVTSSDPHSISNNTVYTINEDRQGRIWVGTVSGVNLYNPEADNFTRITRQKLGRSCIYDIYEDDQGMMWFATYNHGLILHNQNTDEWQEYSKNESENSISTNKVISIFCDKDNNLWLGTDGGGLNYFDRKRNNFEVFDEQHGIPSSLIYGVLDDDKGQLWLSTNNGIVRFNPETRTGKHYGKFDNLQSPQFNYKAYMKASDGRFYFGGINGFNVFHPDSIRSIPSLNSVTFTNLQLFNKDVKLNNAMSPLKKVVNYSTALTFSDDQSVVSFEYAAMSYLSPKRTRYAFKMEGFDNDWNYVGGQRKATYTNLPPGDYVFKVKATNNDGSWQTESAVMGVTILPPFYQSAVAYLIYCLLAIILFIAARRTVIRRQEKRNRIRLKKLKNKEEKAFYKQKIEFFTTMAHEIRTPLSLITAPLEDLISSGKGGDEVQEQLQIMDKNSSRLLTLVNQLLDFRRIESKAYVINREKMELVTMVQALYSRFSPIALKQEVEFSLSTKTSRQEIEADPEALTKILSNLLINAFKFTRSCVALRINEPFKDDHGQRYLSISVEDDGIGIPREQLQNIFKKFFKITSGKHHYSNLGGTGIGLALAKSLCVKHGGDLLVESNEGVRTIFTVLIPLCHCDTPERDAGERLDKENDMVKFGAQRQTILLAEDDASLRAYISANLKREGYRCVTAKNGVDAMQLLEKEEVDLIISDLMMPEMNGIAFCSEVKNRIDHSHLPFLLLTAKSNLDAEIESIESGADGYITKPFAWRHVRAVIKNQLELRSRLRSKFSQQPFAGTATLATNSRDEKFLQKIVGIIETRMTDPQLSVEELSRDLAMSRSSLHKKLKSVTGQAPNEFIRLVRLKKAAKLLIQNEYNVSEVGYMTGFKSHSYFSKCFFQQFQIAPSEFREKHLQQKTLASPE